MEIENTPLEGCIILKPGIFKDERGAFLEHYNHKIFKEVTGTDCNFVQDNLSVSSKGVLRGLHFQKGTYSQAKLVSVLKGKVQDVVVDLRRGSATFGQSYSTILDDKSRKQLFIPKGFAHGFLALSDEVLFAYKCDSYYAPGEECGIRYNDPELDIEWQLKSEDLILSEKDKNLQTFRELKESGLV